MSFGERVRRLREISEISQTELGAAIHMTQRKVSYLECGKCEPSLTDLIELCCFFDVSADYLIGLPEKLPFPK